MLNISKRQAYRYNVQFNYSVGVSCESFLKNLPAIGVKNAVIAKDQK